MNEEKKTVSKKNVNSAKKTSSTKKRSSKTPSKKTTTPKKRSTTTATKKNNTVKKVEKKIESQEEKTKSIAMESKEEVKSIPKKETKNQNQESIFALSIVGIILASILVVASGVKGFMEAKENSYSEDWKEKSYLVEKYDIHQITCDEIPNTITKENSFIFITSYGTEEEFNLEKKLKKIIEEYHLKDNFYVYPLMDNCGPISNPGSVAGQNLKLTEGIQKVPTILYYKNGKFIDKIEREDQKMMESADFVKMLDIYEIKK